MRYSMIIGVMGISCAADAPEVSTLTASSQGGLDLDGTPDLVVREDILAAKWSVKNEKVTAGSCEQVEGNIEPGTRRVVRFAVGVANVGDADMLIGDPNDAVNTGLFELAECHAHYHFRNYATYELIDPTSGTVWRAAKRGFCMIDIERNPKELGGSDRPKIFDACGSIGVPGFQGISRGWTDTYSQSLPGQYFVLDGGDGQPVVPSGTYRLRITANPPFVAAPGEPCPYTDPDGKCHMLPESNYANNVTEISVSL